MLRPADIEVDLAPVVALGTVAEGIRIVRVHVAQEVPARPGPPRHRVVLHAVAPADVPLFGAGQRWVAVLGRQVGVHVGHQDLLVLDELGNAVHIADGEGRAPVALAAEDRVAQPEVDAGLDKAGSLGLSNGEGQGFVAGQAIPICAVAEHGLLVGLGTGLDVVSFEDGRDGQVERLGEFPVALVAGRDSHDSTRAVPG